MLETLNGLHQRQPADKRLKLVQVIERGQGTNFDDISHFSSYFLTFVVWSNRLNAK